MPTLYLSAQIIMVSLTFTLIYFLMRSLRFAFDKLAFRPAQKRKLLYFIAGGLICWLGILAALSFIGFFSTTDNLPIRIFMVIAPTLALIFYLLFSKSFFKVINCIPPAWLVYVQSFRILVEIVLWLGVLGNFVPFQMSFTGFNYDIVVGITALLGGYVFFTRNRFRRFEAMIWNIFGIVLLLNIVAIAILSAPSPFRVFLNEPANTFIAHVPFIWLPGFLVPFALAMHLFSIKQILLHKPSSS